MKTFFLVSVVSATRILIVDDEDEIRSVLKEHLEHHGYKCSEAANGKEALEILQKEQFSIVISDVRMPVMDGIELLERSRQLPEPPVVILMTAYTNLTFEKAREKGAFALLSKPFSMNQILESVLSALK